MLVNNYGEVKVDKISITRDKIEVLDNEYKLLTSISRPYTRNVHEISWVEVFKGYIKKPRSITHSQFAKMLPDALKEYVCIEEMNIRRERIAACINWPTVYKIKEIDERIQKLKDNPSVPMITSMLHLINGHTSSY